MFSSCTEWKQAPVWVRVCLYVYVSVCSVALGGRPPLSLTGAECRAGSARPRRMTTRPPQWLQHKLHLGNSPAQQHSCSQKCYRRPKVTLQETHLCIAGMNHNCQIYRAVLKFAAVVIYEWMLLLLLCQLVHVISLESIFKKKHIFLLFLCICVCECMQYVSIQL